MKNEYEIIRELVNRYSQGKLHLEPEQAQSLAQKAYQFGIDFDVKGKPFRKMAFDAVDMASFGMLPNKWRPYSPGQDLYGEPGWDKTLGGLGTLAGLGTGIGLGVKGAKAAVGSFRSGGRAAEAIAKVKEMEAIKRSQAYASRFYGGKDPYGLDFAFNTMGSGSARFLP